jgi:hypothetical protein
MHHSVNSNIYLSGEFYKRTTEEAYVRGERAETVVHADTLRMEGKFHDATTSGQDYKGYSSQRGEIVRHEDNLTTEGRFTGMSTSHDEYRQVVGERAETKYHEDNLKITG